MRDTHSVVETMYDLHMLRLSVFYFQCYRKQRSYNCVSRLGQSARCLYPWTDVCIRQDKKTAITLQWYDVFSIHQLM